MKQIGKLLKTPRSDGLETLILRAQDMDELAQKLRAELEPALAAELAAVNLRDSGELVVVCSTSGWAARMRYEGNKLLETARAAGVQATACRFRVAGS